MIDLLAAFSTLARYRADDIVIACQTARGPWFKTVKTPHLDVFFRGSMGKGSSLGLGLALACPKRRVIILDGDGSLLMNLGSLVTIAQQRPANLYLFVLENGVYAGTGGQPIPGRGIVSFSGLARAAGFPESFEFDQIADFDAKWPAIVQQPGPTFICLKTELPPLSGKKEDSLPTLEKSLASLKAILSAFDP